MKPTEANASAPAVLARRTFLSGSAAAIAGGAAAAAALGMEPALAAAADLPLSIAYWDGGRFTPAHRLPSADRALAGATVRLRLTMPAAAPAERRLRAVDVHFPAAVNGRTRLLPFHALTVSPGGGAAAASAVFVLPVHPEHGIVLVALGAAGRNGTGARVECRVRLSAGSEPGAPKLRAGTYVLALGVPDWSRFAVDETAPRPTVTRRSPRGSGSPAGFEHVVLTVSAAAGDGRPRATA